jgi:hypothetical protein
MKRAVTLGAVLILGGVGGMAGCASPKGSTPDERRQYVMQMRDEALEDLYREKPEARDQVATAAGYGVFRNLGQNIIFVETGGGFGIVRDNKTGEDTYMKMRTFGLGLGLGATDFRAVYIFRNEAVLGDFVRGDYQVGAKAQAAAKTGDEGGAATATGEPDDDIIVYQFTKSGVVASATVQGSKYSVDKALNAK